MTVADPKVSAPVPLALKATIPVNVAVIAPVPDPGTLCVRVIVKVSDPVHEPLQLKAKLPMGDKNGVNGTLWLVGVNVIGTEPITLPAVVYVTGLASASEGNNSSAASRTTFLIITHLLTNRLYRKCCRR